MKIFITLLFLSVLSFAVSAQTKVVPILDMKIGGLLGGVQNGKFLNAKTTVAKLIAEQNYTLFLLDGKNESLKLKKPKNEMDVCDDFYGLEFDEESSEKRYEKGGVALGEGFVWKPVPRASKAIELNNAEYKKIVADYLRAKRITKAESVLTQAIRVDLDGDGKEEVLLTATKVIPYDEGKEGEVYDQYSVVLLRKIIRGKPQTILIAGEFYPRSGGGYDGNVFEISSILDLNGDGKMELVVYSQYYEGGATQVFQMLGNALVEIKLLAVGCGV